MWPRPHDDRFTRAGYAMRRLLDRAEFSGPSVATPLAQWYDAASAGEHEAAHAFLANMSGIVARTLITGRYAPAASSPLLLAPTVYQFVAEQPQQDAISNIGDDDDCGHLRQVDLSAREVTDVVAPWESYVVRVIAAAGNDDFDTGHALYRAFLDGHPPKVVSEGFVQLFWATAVLGSSASDPEDTDADKSDSNPLHWKLVCPARSHHNLLLGWALESCPESETAS